MSDLGRPDLSELDDDGLYELVRTVWEQRDPVPDGMVARLQATAALAASDADLDFELMTLVERTADLAGARATRRSPGDTAYTLRFAHDGLDLLVRVDPAVGPAVGPGGEGGARIDCWLVPPAPATVHVLLGADPHAADGPTVTVSDSGRFEVAGLPSGLLRLRLEPHDDSPVFVTPAFEI